MSSTATAHAGLARHNARNAGFSGLWVPLVTPFKRTPHGLEVDHAALASLVRTLVTDGVDGLVVCGTTGEAAALSDAEQLDCLRTVADNAPGFPLVMGVGGEQWTSTRNWITRITDATHGLPRLAGILLTPPHYVRPSQAGVQHWFESLADASAVPVVIYDIPYRTGTTLSRELLLALAAHPNIVGVKDCGGDAGKTLALIRDGRLDVLAGEDLAIFAAIAQGAAGAIAASLHVRTAEFVAMMRALRARDLSTARTLWHGLIPMIEAMFSEPNPGPVKALLAMQGICDEAVRPPLAPVQAATRTRLQEALSLR